MAHPVHVLTEVIAVRFASVPRGRRSWPMHLHHFFQFDVLLAGELTVCTEAEGPFRAKAGDAWLIPPLLRHSFETKAGFRQASFKLRIAPPFWPRAGARWRRLRCPNHLRKTLEAVGAQHEAEGPMAEAQVWAAATLCVVEALGRNGQRNLARPALDRFRQSLWPLLERIENEPHAGWSVARMAAACHMSPDHFSRCFHALLGEVPHRCLLAARMRAAATMLMSEPARPIKEIAEESRYATVHAFSAAFKKALGQSPAAYRRARSEM